MTQVISSPQSSKANSSAVYVPIRQFVEQMSHSKEDNPYSSTFSFIPFIQKIKEKKKDLQKALENPDSDFMEKVEKNLIAFSDPARLDTAEKRQEIIAILFPSLFFEGQMGFVAKPFSKEFFYMTPALQEIFTSEHWEVKISGKLSKGKMSSPALEAGQLILNTFHGRQFHSTTYQTMTFRDKRTSLERHFKVQIVLDYIKTTPVRKVKKLSDAQVFQLFNEWGNEQYWLEQFPPEDFSFEGLVIGYIQDVTETEVLSTLKEMMLSDDEADLEQGEEIRKQLNRLICSYLQMPDIHFGHFFAPDFKYMSLFSWTLLGGLEVLSQFKKEDFQDTTTYGRALRDNTALIIGDLRTIEKPTRVEQQLIDSGYRSLLLTPQHDRDGQTIGLMELASKQPYRFHKQLLEKLRDLISLYAAGTNRWIQLMDNNINFFIQKHFTYIHPSVEWKFIDVSQQYLFRTDPMDDKVRALAPVAFKDVYPLYGQADIVGSSKIRNGSIQADMLDNLERVQKVIRAFRAQIEFQLLDIYLARTVAFSQRLQNGGYISSDESQIVELLTQEIHPLLRELSEQYHHLPKKILQAYFEYLDPRLNIVYRQRKNYEDSVYELNDLISNYLDQQVAKKQELLPHFFEKYITDGVEYNIYLGQSILQSGQFSSYFLKDFRLWQLIQMCEITRLVEKKGQELLVPLSTAQLIFIYNNPLSIRFNMDEKQFDVDGAYNVRYEILKKRIDKAVIKGTSERLTQRGKVAMVWLQEKDRTEYLEYIDHLRQIGYITDEIEELELEKLQGADGLKALRVTVVV